VRFLGCLNKGFEPQKEISGRLIPNKKGLWKGGKGIGLGREGPILSLWLMTH
jgi:hypothetical protein